MFLHQIFSLMWFLSGFSGLQTSPGTWPQHYHVGTRGGSVTITCPLEADNVHWSRTNTNQKALLLTNLNLRGVPRYTCTDVQNGTSQATVHVLVHGRPLIVQCVTDSYCSHELRCSTDREFRDDVLVRAKAYKWNNPENSPWKQSSHKKDSVHFTVPISSVFCPYEEYTNSFHVLVELMTEKEYWMVDMPISMTHVVVPSAPENLKVKDDNITWEYPSSWARPSSFFPLLFQVKFRKRNNMVEEKMLKEMTYRKENIYKFQVRCRDLYSPSSPWSAWSPKFYPQDPIESC